MKLSIGHQLEFFRQRYDIGAVVVSQVFQKSIICKDRLLAFNAKAAPNVCSIILYKGIWYIELYVDEIIIITYLAIYSPAFLACNVSLDSHVVYLKKGIL